MRRHSRSSSVGDVEKPRKDIDDRNKSEIPEKRRYGFFKDILIDYTSNSNLHGLKYIGEHERTFVEKIFWLLMFVCCVVLCAGLIRKVWLKWDVSPVIVSFAETSTPIYEIPFPAITICFETKALQTKFNFTEYYHLYNSNSSSLTEEEKNLFEDISLVCDDHLSPPSGRKTSDPVLIMENLLSVVPNMSALLFGCKWKDTPRENCSELISPIITEEGQCYTFNTLGANELLRTENLHTNYQYIDNVESDMPWNLEGGYQPGTPLETYPHRGTGYGAKAGLTFVLKANEIDLDYLCKGPVQGFKILLHNPAELPRLSQQYFRSPFSQEVVVAVKPKMMTTSEGLRPYEYHRRQCFFPDERYLRYFKIYTQANCEMECLTNFTYVRCGCVNFGLPYGPDMDVCNAGSVLCMKKAQMELVIVEALHDIEKLSADNDTRNPYEALQVAKECRCLPACTSIEYEAETSQADFNWKAIFKAYNQPITEENEDLLYARVMIFFKEAQFITSRRSELYGQTDFLANCGGLLGLFMGFSILSVVEILYFLTLRLYCMLWRRRRTNGLSVAVKEDQKPGILKHPYID